MSGSPPSPGDPSRDGRRGLHPGVIALILVLLTAVGVGIVVRTEPELWWIVAIAIPLVGGILAAVGHEPADRMGRFLKGLATVLALEVALSAITFGIVFWICTSMVQGTG